MLLGQVMVRDSAVRRCHASLQSDSSRLVCLAWCLGELRGVCLHGRLVSARVFGPRSSLSFLNPVPRPRPVFKFYQLYAFALSGDGRGGLRVLLRAVLMLHAHTSDATTAVDSHKKRREC